MQNALSILTVICFVSVFANVIFLALWRKAERKRAKLTAWKASLFSTLIEKSVFVNDKGQMIDLYNVREAIHPQRTKPNGQKVNQLGLF